MVAALAQLKKEFNQDPARMLAWVASFVRNGTTTLSMDEVIDLAFTGHGDQREQGRERRPTRRRGDGRWHCPS